jgi:hypothetical protein
MRDTLTGAGEDRDSHLTTYFPNSRYISHDIMHPFSSHLSYTTSTAKEWIQFIILVISLIYHDEYFKKQDYEISEMFAILIRSLLRYRKEQCAMSCIFSSYLISSTANTSIVRVFTILVYLWSTTGSKEQYAGFLFSSSRLRRLPQSLSENQNKYSWRSVRSTSESISKNVLKSFVFIPAHTC